MCAQPTYRRSKYIRFSYTFVYTLIVGIDVHRSKYAHFQHETVLFLHVKNLVMLVLGKVLELSRAK